MLPNLPCKKTDRVAELDAPRPHKIRQPKKQAPAVPARYCNLAPDCRLRVQHKCDDLNCKIAADYLSNDPF